MCMMVGMAVSVSAKNTIKTTHNSGRVLNVHTWNNPSAGNRISVYDNLGGNDQRWVLKGQSPELYFLCAANQMLALACGGDYNAYLENYNEVYGDWQRHSLKHVYGNVWEIPNKGAGYYERLYVISGNKGEMVRYGYPGIETLDTVRWEIN